MARPIIISIIGCEINYLKCPCCGEDITITSDAKCKKVIMQTYYCKCKRKINIMGNNR